MVAINITVYLDTVCPWCYIGHRTLDRAIELYQRTYPGGSQDTFDFTWRPYYLNPDAPSPGVPMLEKMAAKNGVERVNAISTRLNRVGREHGISFNFEGRTGNTRDSHRIIAFAAPEQRNVLVEKLFESHFEQSGDITSREVLVNAGVAAGLDESETMSYLESDAGNTEVDAQASQARQDGISSVPTVEINGVRIEGAEDAGKFYEAFAAARVASEA